MKVTDNQPLASVNMDVTTRMVVAEDGSQTTEGSMKLSMVSGNPESAAALAGRPAGDSMERVASPAPSVGVRLDSELRERRELLLALNRAARLFVRDGYVFRRIGPAEANRRLREGQPIAVLSTVSTSDNIIAKIGSEMTFSTTGLLFQTKHKSQWAGEGFSRLVTVEVASSEINTYEDLYFVDRTMPGVFGVATVPTGGGEVVVSRQFEVDWQESSMRDNRALLWDDGYSKKNAGSIRQVKKPVS